MRTSQITSFVLLMALLLPSAMHAKVAAKFESLAGLVQYREKKGKWQNAKIGQALTTDTELQTGPNGKATLIFPNGSKVSLAPGTMASLDQYTTGPYGSQTNMSLRMGRMNADIAKVNDANARNHFRVRTPTVVAGVRGTIEEVGHTSDKGTDVVLQESSSEVVDRTGRSSIVPQGGKSQITTGGTTSADKMEMKSSTVTMAGQGTTAGEADMSFSSGDFSFSGNLGDLTDLFDLFDELEALGFARRVTFEKL